MRRGEVLKGMRWGEVLKLISYTTATNDIGDSIETKTERQIFANKTSVKRSEFYQAQMVGLKPELVFEVKLIDYEGEKKLSYEDEEYHIIRTYQKNSEDIELICDKVVEDSQINLTNLIVTTATLAPVFAATTYAYTSSVLNAVNSVTVTPTGLGATEITVNNNVVASGSASGAIALTVGANTITVILRKTARPTRTYVLTITRAAA